MSFFTEVEDGVFKCKCGRSRKQKKGTDYMNLLSHIKCDHPDQKNVVTQSENGQCKINDFFDVKSKTIFSWLEWIIMENREFSFCEKEYVRKYTNLKPISRTSLKKYINLLTHEVENELC